MSATTRVLQRVVFPIEGDLDVLPLYVEGARGAASTVGNDIRVSAPTSTQQMSQVIDRRRYRVPPASRTSFATYFNAFPASYWRRWTVVESVRLRVTLSSAATILVYRSNAKGNVYRVGSRAVAPGSTTTDVLIDLTLGTFADGGWYWFDVLTDDGEVVVESAQWESDVDDDRPSGTATVAITTLNRPADVVDLLGQLASDAALLSRLDEVIVVDQGAKHPSDEAGYPGADKALGGRLREIRQANLGGSGGFSRGMYETLKAARSDYILISDDDVRAEPESVLRAIVFADLARTPTIVGGHMFSMYDRSYLHSMGERIDPWRFWWGPVLKNSDGHHLDEAGLRSTPELHRRIDVDYNGWWMCLIPTDVIRELGLSLPVFIKWDDAEYGLRAGAAGVPTVSLPGVAVWHIPWTDKDDSLDWQAYYHERNRVLAALLHSRYPRGGRLVRESMIHQLKHLLASQYSVAELRIQALKDILSGPEHLHRDLPTKLPEIRAIRKEFPDARVEKDPGAFPAPRSARLARKGEPLVLPDGRIPAMAMAVLGMLKQLRATRETSKVNPEANVAAIDAKWWLLAQVDSAVVSTADGTGAAWYQRDPARFRELLARSIAVHEQLLAAWPTLSRRYRDALPDLVGIEAWQETFERTGPGQP